MERLRRFIWYLAGRLFLLLTLLSLFTVTFYYAMNATNIYIVLKDGMAKRAQVIMMDEDASRADQVFPVQLPAAGSEPADRAGREKPLHLLHGARHRPPAENDVDVVLALGHHRPGGIYRDHPPHRRTGKRLVGRRGPSPVWRRLRISAQMAGRALCRHTGEGKRPVARAQPDVTGTGG